MTIFAMILEDKVIDIVFTEDAPQYPADINGNEIIAVECDETVYVGMRYQDGMFCEYEPDPNPNPTEPPLSETEQLQLETALNVEYLVCLTELNG